MRRIGRRARTLALLTVSVGVCLLFLPSAANAQSSAAATAAAKARALLASESAPSSFPTLPHFDAATKAKGKSVWFISNDAENPFTTDLYNPFVKALSLFGVSVHEFDGQGSAATEAQGIMEAIAAHASLIFDQDFEVSSVQAAVNAAHAAHIPFVEWATVNAGQPPSPGNAAATTYCYTCAGKDIADGVIALGKGKVNAEIITDSDVPVSVPETHAIEAELRAVCPTTCHYRTENVLIANWTTALPTMARTIVTDNWANWIIPMFDPETSDIDPAVVAAGAAGRVHVASYNATAGAAPQLKQTGNPLFVDVGSSLVWSGYANADMVLRVLDGVKPLSSAKEIIPVRLFDRDNVSSVDFGSPDNTWYGPAGKSVKSEYEKVWEYKG